MNHIYESQEFLNSFFAMNPESGKTYVCDEQGYITQKAGDVVCFKSVLTGKPVSLNTFVAMAKTKAKLYVNDNKVCPFLIGAGETKGLQYLRVYKVEAANDCTIYYEGLY